MKRSGKTLKIQYPDEKLCEKSHGNLTRAQLSNIFVTFVETNFDCINENNIFYPVIALVFSGQESISTVFVDYDVVSGGTEYEKEKCFYDIAREFDQKKHKLELVLYSNEIVTDVGEDLFIVGAIDGKKNSVHSAFIEGSIKKKDGTFGLIAKIPDKKISEAFDIWTPCGIEKDNNTGVFVIDKFLNDIFIKIMTAMSLSAIK